MDLLIQDLSAKFGTTFFISAANAGTGYRSINHLGALSPAIFVGSHVSRQGLARHYQLQEGVEVPEHGLIYFSSVGPSYTGQLRPNLVAPGSALSATPLINSGFDMKNGTSMAAPIAAGATAALLSLLRQNDEWKKIEEWRREKIDAVQKKSPEAGKYSLTTVPLMIRTALEDSARELPQFTVAQAGHGLLDIDAAHDVLLQSAAKVNAGLRFTELEINRNSMYGRLYDRSANIPPVKTVMLSLDADGELNETTRMKLRNATTEVRLVKVQIQNTDGTVEHVEDLSDPSKTPFSIALPGKEGEPGQSIVLGLAAGKSVFYSVRHLQHMQTGKTYVAQYDVFQNDQRLLTMLDVVHKPIELSDLKSEINLPGIAVEKVNRVGCFGNADQPIKALAFHRYPVAVTTRDTALNVQLGFGRDDDGRLMVQAYDPDGYLASTSFISKSGQMTSESRTVQMVVPTNEKKGIWEITVNSYSGSWIGDSGYDLLIEAYRFAPSSEHLVVKTETSSEKITDRILSFMNSSGQVHSVTPELTSLERIAPLKPFGIAPNYRTYKKVPVPAVDPKQPVGKSTTVKLEYDVHSETNKRVSSRIDHWLYKNGPDGKFVQAIKAETNIPSRSSSDTKTFRNVPRPAADSKDDLYVAVETGNISLEGPALSQVIDHVDLIVAYPDLQVMSTEPLKADYIAGDSTGEVKLVRVTAPQGIQDETTPERNRKSNATLKVETGDPKLPEITINLPVTLTEPPRHDGSKGAERARATLKIKTDQEQISPTIRIIVVD